MSQQQNMNNAKLSIGDAIVWNSRRIEKLEELVVKNDTNNNDNNNNGKALQNQFDLLQKKNTQLNDLVSKLEERVEAMSHVSLTVVEDDDEDDE